MDQYPKYVTVKYMGYFDGCTYVGGETRNVQLLNDSVLSLQYCINGIMPESWRSCTYEIVYLSKNMLGRRKKIFISDDADLAKLLRSKPNPTVYIDHDNIGEYVVGDNAEQSGEEAYVPSFEAPESSGYGHNTQSTQFDEGLDVIERYASLNWLGDDQQPWQSTASEDWPSTTSQGWQNTPDVYPSWQYTQYGEWPSWGERGQQSVSNTCVPEEEEWPNTTSQGERNAPDVISSWQDTQYGEWPSWGDRGQQSVPNAGVQEEEEEESDDDDYDPSSEAETDGSASDDMSDGEHIRFSMPDFAGWIDREGGLRRLFALIHAGRNEAEDEPDSDYNEMSNWLVPVIPVDAAASLVDPEVNHGAATDLSVNARYDSKKDLEVAVGVWHIKQGAESKVLKSDKRRVYFRCKHSQICPFDLRASCHDGVFWIVHKFNEEHTCNREMGQVVTISAHSNAVAAYVSRKIYDECEVMKPKNIREELKGEYGVDISYDLALRSRNMAIEMVYGRHEQSFHMLPQYLYMLERANPTSWVKWEVDHSNGRFKQLFIALGASRSGFLWSMRPVIVVDGTHLKGKNHGILFVAVTKDGNEQVYPLAYGVGPKEDDESWKWFLSRLRGVYGEADSLVVVSDAHPSIINAVRSELPNATHALCYYHLLAKIKRYGGQVAALYQAAAYATDCGQFYKAMDTMKSQRVEAYNKLMSVPYTPDKWARSMCPVKRYSFLTSNAAESFNGRLLWARRLPICSMLESIRMVIERWFNDRRGAAQRSTDHLTEEAHRKLAADVHLSRRYTARRTAAGQYRVQAGQRTLLVNLPEKNCECGAFQLDEMPCSHAIAAIR